MVYTLGIDIGSTTSKCVLLQDGINIVSSSIVQAGAGTDGALKAYQHVLENGDIEEDAVMCTIATGYGRNIFEKADDQVSELSCHAKGVSACHPDVRTIIDIGGQDAKIIHLNEKGVIDSFLMNDKCAAGTGRFLEVMSKVLQMDISKMEDFAAKSENPTTISSTCTVFAESEVISQLARGQAREDIVAGICNSVASRVASLAKRGKMRGRLYMSGGVARNSGVRYALSKGLKMEVLHSDQSQLMGALGAAIVAFERVEKNIEKEMCYCE